MKRGASPPRSAQAHPRARGVLRLVGLGLLLLAAGPLYVWLAILFSGELALAQKVSAAEALRGFDFGPVYLEQGVRQRYFLSAIVPEGTGEVWHSTFEVLNSQKQPVFRQDELRFIGEWQFAAGDRDRCAKAFTLQQDSGYYYFRFTALGGSYPANRGDAPVVEFAVRQGVIDGWALWTPAALLALAGALCWLLAWRLICALGERPLSRREAALKRQGPSPGRRYPSGRGKPAGVS